MTALLLLSKLKLHLNPAPGQGPPTSRLYVLRVSGKLSTNSLTLTRKSGISSISPKVRAFLGVIRRARTI